MNDKKLAFIGGDMRQTEAAHRLSQLGFSVSAWGLPGNIPDGVHLLGDLESAYAADVLILPLPISKDGVSINCTGDFYGLSPKIAEVFLNAAKMPICGGSISPRIAEEASRMGVRLYDYYESEELMINNAYLTAEGAVSLAMNELNISLWGTRVCVIGYGRIGKYLSRLLHGLGADVTVCARREESLVEAAAAGCRPLLLEDAAPMGGLSPLCRGHAVLFNTIPAHVLHRDLLMGLERNALLLDLASFPFGIRDTDVREATAERGLRYLRLPSLPGSYAPRDAGRIIAECILEDLSRRDPPSESIHTSYEKGDDK